MHTTLNGNPLGFFSHSQNFSNETEIIDLIKFNLEREDKLDPGHEQDILIISSNAQEFKKGEIFLNQLNGKKYNFGKIYTIMRENIGYSFGAYDHGYQLFKDKYDFYIFIEDDISTYQKNYLIDAVSFWNKTENCGFVPFIEKTKISKAHKKALSIQDNGYISCHGGIGMSSRKVLSEVCNKYGCLPHYKSADQSYEMQILKGEIEFTYKIKELGYSFAEIPKDYIFTAPSFDIMRGLKIRKFPNLAEKIYYYLILRGFIPLTFKILVLLKIKKTI